MLPSLLQLLSLPHNFSHCQTVSAQPLICAVYSSASTLNVLVCTEFPCEQKSEVRVCEHSSIIEVPEEDEERGADLHSEQVSFLLGHKIARIFYLLIFIFDTTAPTSKVVLHLHTAF